MNIDLGFVKENINLIPHICFVYNNEQVKNHIVENFITSGINNGEKVIYFTYDDISTQENINNWFIKYNINLDNAKDILLLSTMDVYYPNMIFYPDSVLNKLVNFYNEAIKQGYKGCRITGEMHWALNNISNSHLLIEYEEKVNYSLNGFNIIGICQYDINKFDVKTIFNSVKVHPYLIVNDKFFKNYYYKNIDNYVCAL